MEKKIVEKVYCTKNDNKTKPMNEVWMWKRVKAVLINIPQSNNWIISY